SRGSTTPNPARAFCLASVITIVGAFSLASNKLIPYVLPAFPSLAILMADRIASCVWRNGSDVGVVPPQLLVAGPLLSLIGAAAIIAAEYAPNFTSPYLIAIRPTLYG